MTRRLYCRPSTCRHTELNVAFRLKDLLIRRARTERVTDLVNLDRVRGLLRTIYWRRRFLASVNEKRRTLNAEADGIPAIVLEPMPASPPLEDGNPFNHPLGRYSPTPPSSPGSNALPQFRSGPLYSPDMSLVAGRHSPTLSVSSQPRPSLGRMPSNSSMLSSDDAHYRR